MRAAFWIVVGVFAVVLAVGLSIVVLWQTSPEPASATGWSLLGDLHDRRGEVSGAVVGHLFREDGPEEFVVVGGLTGAGRTSGAVRAYDPDDDTWRARPGLPAARHHTAAAALDDGTLVVAGGAVGARDWTTHADVWLQDGSGWSEGPSLPQPRYGHQMVNVDGLLYVVGGQGSSAATFIFDGDSWSTGAALPEPRHHLGAAVVDGEIWAIGGRNGDITDRVDIYDPETDSWRSGPALPQPTSGAAVTAIDDTPVVIGGEDPSVPGGGVIERAWYFDGRAWEDLPRPPLAVHGAAVGVLDDRVIVAGGASRQGVWSLLSWTAAVQALDPGVLP